MTAIDYLVRARNALNEVFDALGRWANYEGYWLPMPVSCRDGGAFLDGCQRLLRDCEADILSSDQQGLEDTLAAVCLWISLFEETRRNAPTPADPHALAETADSLATSLQQFLPRLLEARARLTARAAVLVREGRPGQNCESEEEVEKCFGVASQVVEYVNGTPMMEVMGVSASASPPTCEGILKLIKAPLLKALFQFLWDREPKSFADAYFAVYGKEFKERHTDKLLGTVKRLRRRLEELAIPLDGLYAVREKSGFLTLEYDPSSLDQRP